MSRLAHDLVLAAALAACCGALAGCRNPDAQSGEQGPEPQGAGDGRPVPPPTPREQAPVDVQRTPERALAAFAELYINWNYRTLAASQRTLAEMSVGAARLAEQQAAATSVADTTIQQGHIRDSGQLVAIGGDRANRALWCIVTREQTGGQGQYEGLPASYHVTLARLAAVPGGYAVSEWLPQS